jgi:hypothetical protein
MAAPCRLLCGVCQGESSKAKEIRCALATAVAVGIHCACTNSGVAIKARVEPAVICQMTTIVRPFTVNEDGIDGRFSHNAGNASLSPGRAGGF